MPYACAGDGVKLYYEVTGAGAPILFLHEFAGDHRSWEPQVRALSRHFRCITFSARGYRPSDIPADDRSYSQAIAFDDALAVLDHLAVERAHVVGHSMGAYTALMLGLDHPERCRSLTLAGCGWGSDPRTREQSERSARDLAAVFREQGMAAAAAVLAHSPARLPLKGKDPRGWAESLAWLGEQSAEGHALTMLNVQLRRPTLYALEERLRGLTLPMLIVAGDEDAACVDGGIFLKRAVSTAGLLVLPRTGHAVPSEEPEAFNRAVLELFTAADAGRWMAHRA